MANPPHLLRGLVLVLALSLILPLATAEDRPPNVVVIFADDLGYGDLSCYGATKLQTPNIDRLAAEGKRFTDAHSASAVCTPSRYALVTGRYPFRAGLSKPVFLKTGLIIETERRTVADVMKDAGYATACIGKWHLGFGDKTPDWNGDLKPGPLELGFDHYYGVPVVNSHPPFVYVDDYRVVGLLPEDPLVYNKRSKTPVYPEKMGFTQIGGGDAAHALYEDSAVGTHLTEKSVQWIKENKDEPFFLYLSTTNIHHPFTPAPQFVGTSECGLYGDFVHELDWIVGQVMETLEAEGVADNTLILFTSDNGGMANETGQKAVTAGHQLNGELLGFKFDAWEGGHRVPFIVKWPGKVEAGSVSDELISNIDLMATMAAITGQELGERDAPDSFNMLPVLTGEAQEAVRDHLIISPMKPSHLAYREGDWIYIHGKGGGGFGSPKPGTHGFGGAPAVTFAGKVNSDIKDGKFVPDAPVNQLYNLQSDKNQTRNVIREEAERGEAMRAKLEQLKAGEGTRPGFVAAAAGPEAMPREFDTRQLSDKFHSESATLADLDNDGDQDVICGPYWYAGPDFEKRHPIYKENPFEIGKYSNNFFVYTDDLDADGWQDILVLGFPAREGGTYWFRNPGKKQGEGPWEKHVVFQGVENESPVWCDLDGDGKKEVLCSIGGQFGLVAPTDRDRPEQPWEFTALTPPKSTGGKFTHGLGYGDVDGDGRLDLLEKTGWWQHPKKGVGAEWVKHDYPFSTKGGAQMWAYDFNGDGYNDVISSEHAHGYGLLWFEHVPGLEGEVSFKPHRIMGETPGESPYGVCFSQLHALRLDDVDGDGVQDIVTGKRYFAHGGKDPGGKDAAVLYWFRTVRDGKGGVDFVPYQIDDDSGVGTDVTTGDLNGDGLLDVIVGNKKGCFISIQTKKPAEAPEKKGVVKTQQGPVTESTGLGESKIEGEALKVLKKTGMLRRQNVARIGKDWSGGTQLWWADGKPGDVLELELPVAVDGEYELAVALTTSRNYAIVQFSLNGEKLGEPIDLYTAPVIHAGEVVLAEKLALKAGNQKLQVTITGINPKAIKRHMFGLDYVVLRGGGEKVSIPSLNPEKKQTPKGAKELKEGNSVDSIPMTPAEQLASFSLPEGFTIELVASEETGIPKPTSMAFDDSGRLWVTTAVEYPRDKDLNIWRSPGRDKVVVIDQPHLKELQPVRTFADGMVMPMGVLPYREGAIIAQGPELLFLDDADGDGKADQRTVLVRGFGVQDTHTLPHQLARMPGGRVTFSQGVLGRGTVIDSENKSHPFSYSRVASLRPDGTGFRIIGAGLNNIWSWAHTRRGRVFIHEANDLGYSLVQFEEDTSYPAFIESKMHPDAPLHPPTAEGLNLGGTGFSGIAICEDLSGSFPDPWQGRLFVANPITGKINVASAEMGWGEVWDFTKHEDLVSTTDPMFRPVAVSFGPDGCLYIVDWYNRIISHNEVERDHPARDKERGRIWRVRHESQEPVSVKDYTKVATVDLPAALKSDSTWAMRAAWHQMADRDDRSVVSELVALVKSESNPADVRIHALWTLEELEHFDESLWKLLLEQSDADIRREAVRSLDTFSIPSDVTEGLLSGLGGETSWSVRYEVLRYLRRNEVELSERLLQMMDRWSMGEPKQSKVTGFRNKKEFFALDGSYQRAFQDFLIELAKSRTQLPVVIESKFSKVLEKNPTPADAKLMASRVAQVKPLVSKGDIASGKLLTESVCLTCHSIGGEGVGFAPPLDGSSKRDLDGLLTAIINPDAAMENVFRAYRIEKKDGTILEGFRESESKRAISILAMGGARIAVKVAEVERAGYIDGKSAMMDVTGGMTAQQVADIVAFLRTVK